MVSIFNSKEKEMEGKVSPVFFIHHRIRLKDHHRCEGVDLIGRSAPAPIQH